MRIEQFQNTILDWHRKNKRDLPWHHTRDPYHILVSEIMLHQTQVSRVLPKYREFLFAFPTIETLATAKNKKLLQTWQGLGYWRRARYLKQIAQYITTSASGKFPKDPKELEQLPGIGHYTARAIACFSFNKKEAFLDTNIRRVYLHFFFQEKTNVSDKEILPVAQKAIDALPPGVSPREWHYALFNYGANCLKDKTINKKSKHYSKQGKLEGSFRSYRTKVVNHLLSQRGNKDKKTAVEKLLHDSPYESDKIIASLLRDGLIKEKGQFFTI